MTCPKCKGKTKVVDSRDLQTHQHNNDRYKCVDDAQLAGYNHGTARMRVCKACGHRFPTVETKLNKRPQMSQLQKNFIAAVFEKICKLGINESKFCSLVGISNAHWSTIRNGKARLTIVTMQKIMKAIKLEYEIDGELLLEHEKRIAN